MADEVQRTMLVTVHKEDGSLWAEISELPGVVE
jgi:hypothetical protein